MHNPPTTIGNCDMCGRENTLITPVISDRYGPTGELCCADGCPITPLEDAFGREHPPESYEEAMQQLEERHPD